MTSLRGVVKTKNEYFTVRLIVSVYPLIDATLADEDANSKFSDVVADAELVTRKELVMPIVTSDS